MIAVEKYEDTGWVEVFSSDTSIALTLAVQYLATDADANCKHRIIVVVLDEHDDNDRSRSFPDG